MDINELKKMIRTPNDKVVIIENGKPILVVTAYENQEVAQPALPRASAESAPFEPKREEGEKLTLKDLPFL